MQEAFLQTKDDLEMFVTGGSKHIQIDLSGSQKINSLKMYQFDLCISEIQHSQRGIEEAKNIIAQTIY